MTERLNSYRDSDREIAVQDYRENLRKTLIFGKGQSRTEYLADKTETNATF